VGEDLYKMKKVVGMFVIILLICTVLPVTGNTETGKISLNNPLNKTNNVNCLVIGYTNQTFIAP
jgi:hypothetical protein